MARKYGLFLTLPQINALLSLRGTSSIMAGDLYQDLLALQENALVDIGNPAALERYAKKEEQAIKEGRRKKVY